MAMRKRKLIIALGANVDAEANIELAKIHLGKLFPGIGFSTVVSTEPIGIESDDFLNCIAVGVCVHNYTQVNRALRHIEKTMGGGKGEHRKGIVRIDLDILYFDDRKYHEEDWKRSYIRGLLAEIGEEALI